MRRSILALAAVTLLLAACQTTSGGFTPEPGSQSMGSGIAAFSPPSGCLPVEPERRVEGRWTAVRSTCVVPDQPGIIAFLLTEASAPLSGQITLPPASDGEGQEVLSSILRDVLIERERGALEQTRQLGTVTNRRLTPLAGNGGVPGANACVKFDFDLRERQGDLRLSHATGYRCVRLNTRADRFEEIMLEIVSARPVGALLKPDFDMMARQALGTLRFR